MKLKDIAKRVGGELLRKAIPGAGILIDAFNELTGHPEPVLRPDSTGDEITRALLDYPHLGKLQFDVDLERVKQRGSTMRAMLAAESRSQHTTRPYIAKHSFHVLAFVTITLVAGWLFAVYQSDDPLKNIINGWPFVAALLVPFVALLRAYFGLLSAEHKNRLDSAHGATNPAGVSGFLSTLLRRGKI